MFSATATAGPVTSLYTNNTARTHQGGREMKTVNRIFTLTAVAAALTFVAATASAQGVMFIENDNVGIGTSTPTERLTVANPGGNASLLFDGGASANFLLDRGNTASFSRFVFLTNGALKWSLGMTNDGSHDFTLGPFASVSYFYINQTNGRVGFGTKTPANPLQMASGAYVSAGGVWTNASSRDFKTDISELSATEALEALSGMQPVLFRYKATDNERHVGFIAEDVPDLVATQDRKGLSSMDVVAVLTKVVQEQQATLEAQHEMLEEQRALIEDLRRHVETAK
jgi:hypothetical protein